MTTLAPTTIDLTACPAPAPERVRIPTALVRAVHGGVSVLIERSKEGVLTGETRYQGEVRGWGGLTSMDDVQLRELAAHARCLRTHGDDGRRAPMSTYSSVGGGS